MEIKLQNINHEIKYLKENNMSRVNSVNYIFYKLYHRTMIINSFVFTYDVGK